jgi:hypothetical protein
MVVVYRHIRLDTNEVFYIGIGAKEIRAYATKDRSNWWNNIISKTLYEVEIIFEHEDYEFIKEKEKEFIKLYGRRDLGLGTLVNMTNGGEGTIGVEITEDQRAVRRDQMMGCKNPFYGKKHTEETKKKISDVNSNVIVSQETRSKLSKALKGREVTLEEMEKRYSKNNHITRGCYHIITGQYFKSLAEGCRYFKIGYRVEKNRVLQKGRYRSFDYAEKDIRSSEFTCFDEITNRKFKSLAEACRELGLNYNQTRKKYKSGLIRIKSISEIKQNKNEV